MPITEAAVTAIAQSASELIFQALNPYRLSDEQLQELASQLDDQLEGLLIDLLLPTEETEQCPNT